MKDPKKMTIRELRAALENLRRGNEKEKRQPYDGQDVLFAQALNLNGLQKDEEGFLAVCQRIYRDADTKPAETLLYRLIREYSRSPLRPEDVASEVEDFESFYQIFIQGAKEAAAEYAEEIGIPEVAYA